MLVPPHEKAYLDQLRAGTHMLILKNDFERLSAAGRYQKFDKGYRTWRLDTATGAVCIMLTGGEDWEKPETARQACQ
jgi:hypothetical protein